MDNEHIKICSTYLPLGNANQNHNKITYHTHQDSYNQKDIISVGKDVQKL